MSITAWIRQSHIPHHFVMATPMRHFTENVNANLAALSQQMVLLCKSKNIQNKKNPVSMRPPMTPRPGAHDFCWQLLNKICPMGKGRISHCALTRPDHNCTYGRHRITTGKRFCIRNNHEPIWRSRWRKMMLTKLLCRDKAEFRCHPGIVFFCALALEFHCITEA